MADITIPLPSPAERPAVPAKEFASAYIMDLAVSARSMGAQDSIYVEYVPYDKLTGDRLLSDRREIRLPLWEAVEEIPEVATAYAAIAAAIPALVAYQAAKEAAAAAPAVEVPVADPVAG
jgi:hypothetical protein